MVVEEDINIRWEQGMPHHPESERVYKILSEADENYGNRYFDWKCGGDGDNGETLMFELDVYFEKLEQNLIDGVQMDYKEELKNLGFKKDYDDHGIATFSNDKILIRVIEREDGYHECEACPREVFDRWANSSHIKWRIMVANYDPSTKCGWRPVEVQADFIQKVQDALWFAYNLPGRMFDKFITIEM